MTYTRLDNSALMAYNTSIDWESSYKSKTFTITLTEAELDLIYDQLNLVELYDDSEETAEVADSINSKITEVTNA